MPGQPSKPWDLPPPPEAGDAVVFGLYSAVGLAISMWEMVELHLAALYTLFTSEQEGETFIIQFRFDGSAGFRSRSEKITEAFDRFIMQRPDQVTEGVFYELMHRAGQLSMRRNDIAHGMAMNSMGWAEGDPKGFLLFPAFQNFRKWPGERPLRRPTYKLNSIQIVAFASAFVDLRHDIERLEDRMFGRSIPGRLIRAPLKVLLHGFAEPAPMMWPVQRLSPTSGRTPGVSA